MKFMVTGGAGYIGSHLCELLDRNGHEVLAVDKVPIGHSFAKKQIVNLLNAAEISEILSEFRPDGVFHLAGNSSMSASFNNPDSYLQDQITMGLNLITSMNRSEATRVIFSSSCSVYGNSVNALESDPLIPLSPYAASKQVLEQLLFAASRYLGFQVGIFRFFNVIGRNAKAGLDEKHFPETHLLPLIMQSIAQNTELEIYGHFEDTPDGSAIRDYVDVQDVSEGMLLGMELLVKKPEGFFDIWNLGSEQPISIFELISKVEEASGRKVARCVSGKRAGDPSQVFANSSKARYELGWKPVRSTLDSIKSLLEST
jgi:UDP-glucose-4-epimerase GalE